MNHQDVPAEFVKSALNRKGEYMTTDKFLAWVGQRRNSVKVSVEQVPFSKLNKWRFDDTTGNLIHESGRFFSIIGVDIKTNWGNVKHWTQPIINQAEVGILGILAKKINGVLHFLMQCKIEPGNINWVQISPTLQATKSNYTRVHQGNAPAYLEYFNGGRKTRVLLDQLQSEQGARFLRKRNRNIILEVEEDVVLEDDFCWLTLGQLKDLLRTDNLINMDSRTVLSGINVNLSTEGSINLSKSLHSMEELISWITGLKSFYELEVTAIPLKSVNHWIRTEDEIRHEDGKYFSIIAADVQISNREVVRWSQPLVKSAQEGLIAFIVKKFDGVTHFLVQAKIEAGNFDILELAPSVQCLTGNYRRGKNEYEVPFIDVVLNAPPDNIVYKAMQSEEGGRFYQEQNLNMIVRVDNDFPQQLPPNYCWMTQDQLYMFIRFNNYLNIQARSLLAALPSAL